MRRSSEISALNIREAKSWKVIDQLLSPKHGEKIPAAIRFAAAEFVLCRLYPEKKVIAGDGPDGEIIIRVEKGNPDASDLQAPRFAIPNLQ